MKVFLCHSSRDSTAAEEISLALEAQGHDVFLDRHDLSGGDDFHSIIRERIADAGLFLFLITPDSVREGAYTLTELRMARDKWAHPKKRVLPVLLEPTDMESIPAYLRGVTILEPEGDVAAEIAALLARRRRRLTPILFGSGLVVLLIVVALLIPGIRGWIWPAQQRSFTSSIELSDFVMKHLVRPDEITRTEYSLDPSFNVSGNDDGVVVLQRLSFGVVEEVGLVVSVSLAIRNTTDRPVLLDVTPRFFELADDLGNQAELLYFGHSAEGELLGPGERRQIRLIYRSVPGWKGKETKPDLIYFRVTGLIPLVRGTWSFAPLSVAD